MPKPKPGSYIDTQGMSGPTDPNAKDTGKVEYKPAVKKPSAKKLTNKSKAKTRITKKIPKKTYNQVWTKKKFVKNNLPSG